jgi:hypothetical protein
VLPEGKVTYRWKWEPTEMGRLFMRHGWPMGPAWAKERERRAHETLAVDVLVEDLMWVGACPG